MDVPYRPRSSTRATRRAPPPPAAGAARVYEPLAAAAPRADPPRIRSPEDPGCPCGGSGICAPQRCLTHAEYSQVIRARVAIHRQRNDRVSTAARVRPDDKLPRFVPARQDRGAAKAARAPADIDAVWRTERPLPTVGRWRGVRRYAAWYGDGGVSGDDRVVAAVPPHSGDWRERAAADADAVVRRLGARGAAVHKAERTVDRRGASEDRIALAEVLCMYTNARGKTCRAVAAHCVTLTDDSGRTLASLVYLPTDE